MSFKKYTPIIVASVGSIIHLINDARSRILETIKFHEKSVPWEPSCSIQNNGLTDGRT
jgi:hypothetical protein